MIIISNWKMNKDLDQINLFLDNFKNNLIRKTNSFSKEIKILIAPSFPFLVHVKTHLFSEKISIVSQNCHHEDTGAFTGEVSVKMLNSIGIKYVIIGHSERRINFNEENSILEKKINLCLENHLCPIVCFGETAKDR